MRGRAGKSFRGRTAPAAAGALLLALGCGGGDPVGPSAGTEVTAAEVRISGTPSTVRQGDVHGLTVEVLDAAGRRADLAADLSVVPPSAGHVTPDGRFVAYATDELRLVATAGEVADTVVVASRPRGLAGRFELVGRGEVSDRFTSDLWVRDGYAYTGTWSCRGDPKSPACGNALFVWDVRDPAAPTIVDSVIVDARVVNDVKISADGRLAVITHEQSLDGMNGITLLDLADPAHPEIITRYTAPQLTPGVHNTWIDGNHVYAVVDGVVGGLLVLDVSDPTSPRQVFFRQAESSFLHDVYVRDGLAWLSHWDDGLIVLDVAGGFPEPPPDPGPEAPVDDFRLFGSELDVARIRTAGGETHNVWWWPAGRYAFVGEEDIVTPGVMHVVDTSNLGDLREVATFALPRETPHNFWLDEQEEILYAAWHGQGLRAIDVSGELLGELDRQGREIAGTVYTGQGDCPRTGDVALTCTWAPQLEDGLVYVSDLNSGLWIFRLER